MDERYPLSLIFVSCPNIKHLLEYQPEEINKAFNCCGGTRLHHLVSKGLGEEVLKLLNKGANVNLIDSDGQTALNIAITKKSVSPDIVKIIAQKTSDLNVMTREGKIALHLAVYSANSEAVKILLQLSANIDFQDRLGNSPLHYALNYSLDLVEILVENGANVDVKNNNGETPLHVVVGAYMMGRMDAGQLTSIISILSDKGANINLQTKDGKTILHILGCFRETPPNIVELHTFLLSKGAQVHLQDHKGTTPLYLAVKQNAEYLGIMLRTESGKSAVNIPDNQRNYPLFLATKRRDFKMVKLLLDNGAIIDSKNEFDETPLYLALKGGKMTEPIFNLLIDRGAQVACKDKYMKTPLHTASERSFGQQKLRCTTLLTKGASPNVRDNTGMTPLHYAVESNRKDIVQLLVENGAELNIKNETGETPLHISTYHSGGTNSLMQDAICRILLDKKASLNVQDDDGMTPLHNAVTRNNKSLVKLLLENGADVNSKNKNDETPLHVLARQCHNSKTGQQEIICKSLLEKGALPNAQDVYGNTPLHNAVKNYTTNIIQLLIENKSEVNITNKKGKTPLHLSTHRCRDNSLQELTCSTLIAKGALINVKDRFGMTPLHNAVKDNTTSIVQLLLENGADLNSKNEKGESPIRYVRNVDTLEVLLENGAEVNEQDNYGRTVLHNIARDFPGKIHFPNRFKSILLNICKLLEWGVSQNNKDNSGKLPFDYYSFDGAQKFFKIKRTCLYSTYQLERDRRNSDTFQKLHKICCDEVDRMKLKILGKNSLYDIFRHYDDPNFLSNGELESAVLSKDFKVKFPGYYSMLTSTYLRSKVRVQLFHHVVDILQTPLPFEVMRYILTFVDDDSLKNVIKAKEESPAKGKTDTASNTDMEPDLELNSENDPGFEYDSDWEYDSDSEFELDWEIDSDSEFAFYWKSEIDQYYGDDRELNF